jgi:acetyl-CoA carboxylase biotin carboxylase subunit
MNTRLQVEHPVTEEVWGVDLAAAMISIALGEELPFDAAGLAARGHAIECRVYAEDPRRGFAPSPGLVSTLRLPEGPGVRNDVGVEAGSVVPIDYDPMLGKLIVHAPDRARAIARLSRALADYEIGGVETTLPLFRVLAADPEFASGEFDVQWLDRRLAAGLFPPAPPSADEVWLAAAGLAAADAPAAPAAPAAPSPLWRGAARREAQRG